MNSSVEFLKAVFQDVPEADLQDAAQEATTALLARGYKGEHLDKATTVTGRRLILNKLKRESLFPAINIDDIPEEDLSYDPTTEIEMGIDVEKALFRNFKESEINILIDALVDGISTHELAKVYHTPQTTLYRWIYRVAVPKLRQDLEAYSTIFRHGTERKVA